MDDRVPTLQDIITVGHYFSNCVNNESFKHEVNIIFLIPTNRIVCDHDQSNLEKSIDSFICYWLLEGGRLNGIQA